MVLWIFNKPQKFFLLISIQKAASVWKSFPYIMSEPNKLRKFYRLQDEVLLNLYAQRCIRIHSQDF